MSKLTTPSVLAFERRLDISDAVFYQKNSQDEKSELSPVIIREKSVRGTISNRLKNAIANTPAKLDAEIEKPNLQTVDTATLDHHNDTLVIKWSLKVLPFAGKPNVCNNPEYQTALEHTVSTYLQQVGIEELAKRYAYNIINARWLWRNRMGAEQIKININLNQTEKCWEFNNVKPFSLNHFDYQDQQLNEISNYIGQGLKGEQLVILNIQAEAIVGYGQEVYPSQELVLDNSNNRKSKILYQVKNIAGIHSQKISNAIRTIDTWYQPNAPFPIATEPYGAVTTLGVALRQPKDKLDFYNLFDNWLLKHIQPAVEQQHYVISVLIRGGVFGASSKE